MLLVQIDGSKITDRKSFHDVLAKAFGFPRGYGKNLDALVDCLTYLDKPSAKMSRIHVVPGYTAVLVVENSQAWADAHPALVDELVRATSFVNHRRIRDGLPPVISLAFDGN